MTVSKSKNCPVCKGGMAVTDSRPSTDESVLIRRVRRCTACSYRCTTHEVIVADTLGFANTNVQKAMRFIACVEDAARREFSEDFRVGGLIGSRLGEKS